MFRRQVCILDRKKIAWHYLKGRFWLDFLTSLPVHSLWHFGSLAMAQGLRIYELFIEILRIDRAVRLSEFPVNYHVASAS